jgi:hypothetical protein
MGQFKSCVGASTGTGSVVVVPGLWLVVGGCGCGSKNAKNKKKQKSKNLGGVLVSGVIKPLNRQ